MRARRIRCGAAWLAALILGAQGVPGEAGAIESREKLRRDVIDFLSEFHLKPEGVDVDGMVTGLEQRIRAGVSPADLNEWLWREVLRQHLAFATPNPDYNESFKYHLPFDRRVPWLVGQGANMPYSHTGRGRYAFDFAMPEGTPVLAARRGQVVRVIDGFTRCCLPKEEGYKANLVVVAHRDGSFAEYVHLRRGIPVREGQMVAAGSLLGYSGSTGYAKLPHLHFEVAILDDEGVTSVPIRFRDGSPEGYEPKTWRLYANRPRTNMELRASLGGRRLRSGEPIQLADRSPLPLEVELVVGPGQTLDVTADPATRYVALTPWSVAVGSTGRVSFGTPEPWEPLAAETKFGLAIVTIIYETDEPTRRAYFDVHMEFESRTP